MNASIKRFVITIGLFSAIVLGFYLILKPASPSTVQADIYTLRFLGDGWDNRYQIQGDNMLCQQIESYPSTHCTTTFEGKPLEINVVYTDETRHLASLCRVKYDGAPIPCEPTINYENRAPTLIIRDNLGISPERFAELRAETPLLYWSEDVWFNVIWALAAMFAFAVIIWRWWRYPKIHQDPEPTATRFISSLFAGFCTWLAFTIGTSFIFGHFFFDYADAFWKVIPFVAASLAAVAFFWEWKMMGGWKPETAVYRLTYSIGGGIIIFFLLNFMFVGDLLFLGFID